jgi:hypothetical protein
MGPLLRFNSTIPTCDILVAAETFADVSSFEDEQWRGGAKPRLIPKDL